MDEHDATEQAYKNGYENGYRDGKESATESIMFPKLLVRAPEPSKEELEALLLSPTIIHKSREEIIPLFPFQWIAVTERLPEEDTRVLVWIPNDPRSYTKMDTDRLHEGRWVRWGLSITHWMPLPQPPKGE